MLCNSETLISRALRSIKMLVKINVFSKSCYNIRNKSLCECHRLCNLMSIFPMLLTVTIPAVKEHSWLTNYKMTTNPLSHIEFQSLKLHFKHSQPLQGYI